MSDARRTWAAAAFAIALASLILPGALRGQAPDTVRYEVSFPNAAHHEAEVSLTLTGLPATPLELRMSRSSPGRYALHEFAKNVYAVRVADGRGRPLTPTRPASPAPRDTP